MSADLLRQRRLPGGGGPPPARSLLLTVLGEYVLGLGEPVWTAALVRALVALGIREKAARQAIARSAGAGWLERDRVGRQVRWRLSSFTRELLSRSAERIYGFEPVNGGWDGCWLLVMATVPEERRDDRHRLRTRLAWAGFGSLGQGVWITPHVAREREAREALAAIDSSARATSFVARHGQIGDEAELVAEAWGGHDALARHYTDFIDEFAAREPSGSAETFVAQTHLVHEWRRFPFLDPGLPAAFLPSPWPGTDARALFTARHTAWSAPAQAWFRAGNVG
ncbi:MAG: PaaX family transcriptional regulator [Egibacteraceae bacterium]